MSVKNSNKIKKVNKEKVDENKNNKKNYKNIILGVVILLIIVIISCILFFIILKPKNEVTIDENNEVTDKIIDDGQNIVIETPADNHEYSDEKVDTSEVEEYKAYEIDTDIDTSIK